MTIVIDLFQLLGRAVARLNFPPQGEPSSSATAKRATARPWNQIINNFVSFFYLELEQVLIVTFVRPNVGLGS